jgi:hypothetical protein
MTNLIKGLNQSLTYHKLYIKLTFCVHNMMKLWGLIGLSIPSVDISNVSITEIQIGSSHINDISCWYK